MVVCTVIKLSWLEDVLVEVLGRVKVQTNYQGLHVVSFGKVKAYIISQIQWQKCMRLGRVSSWKSVHTVRIC
jgi:hypothetical protein